jgi:hypothetical protein
MEGKEDVLKKFYDSFQGMGGRLHILEHRVPVEQQIEYFLYTNSIRKTRRKKWKEDDYNCYLAKLESTELSKGEKKKILSTLASSTEIRAFRLLEQYLQNPDKELVNWASMALMESRIAIETELSGEKQIFISTGLGGKGDKMRFYVLLISSQEEPFATYQREVIEKEFKYILQDYKCEIERLTIYDSYVELVLLMPMATDIRKILETVILECNLYGDFLSKVFTVTNIKEFTPNEISKTIKKYRKS